MLTPLDYALLAMAAYVGAAINATVGLGGGLIPFSTLGTMLSPYLAIPIQGVVVLTNSVQRVARHRQEVRWSIIKVVLLGASIGAVAASFIFLNMPTALLTLIMGVGILYLTWWPKPTVEKAPPMKVWGVMATVFGFFGFFIGAGALVLNAYLQRLGLNKSAFSGTAAGIAIAQTFPRVLILVVSTTVLATHWPVMLVMAAAGGLGIFTGEKVLARVPEHVFPWLVRGFVTIMALRMIWMGING